MLGWENVLAASRLVAAVATILTGLILAWLTLNLTQNRGLSALSAVVFLNGDELIYRGWLAYSDPLFTLFVFGAIACLWVGVQRRQGILLWVSSLMLVCGFMTKAQTAFLFYGVAFAALLNRDTTRFLFGLNSVVAHALAITALILWNTMFTNGLQSNTIDDIVHKLLTVEIGEYLNQLWSFPIETVLRFAPASLILIFYHKQLRGAPVSDIGVKIPWRILVAILIVNYIPYWLGPRTHIRYIMPLYPLISLLIAALIWRCGMRPVTMTLRWLAVVIAVNYVLGLWGFPWYEKHHRGDYAGTAKQITAATQGFPLYVTDVSSTGLSVAANLDTMRHPGPYVHWPPRQWDNGFVLSYTENEEIGNVHAVYPLGRNKLYLLCRGTACRTSGSTAE